MITGRTKTVGVWGHPVGHSRSPAMHNAALAALGLDWVYVPFEVEPGQIPQAIAGLRALNMVGINLTVPLKELALPHLDWVSEEAARIGSVNTIVNQNGSLQGHSTDGAGFLRSLEVVGQPTRGRQALLLGSGGSARAVAFALASQGSRCIIANRTPERAAALAADVHRWYPGFASPAGWGAEAGAFDLIVNTTSLGMHPNEAALPLLPPGALAARPFVYDLIYAPPQTRLLQAAQAAECETLNGVKMLVWQGAFSLSLWTGLPVEALPVGLMEAAVEANL